MHLVPVSVSSAVLFVCYCFKFIFPSFQCLPIIDPSSVVRHLNNLIIFFPQLTPLLPPLTSLLPQTFHIFQYLECITHATLVLTAFLLENKELSLLSFSLVFLKQMTISSFRGYIHRQYIWHC